MQNTLNASSRLMLKPLWVCVFPFFAKKKILKYKRLIAKGHPKREFKPKWSDPSDQTHNHHAVFSDWHTWVQTQTLSSVLFGVSHLTALTTVFLSVE